MGAFLTLGVLLLVGSLMLGVLAFTVFFGFIPSSMVDEERLATVRQYYPDFTPYGPRPAEEQFSPRRGRKVR